MVKIWADWVCGKGWVSSCFWETLKRDVVNHVKGNDMVKRRGMSEIVWFVFFEVTWVLDHQLRAAFAVAVCIESLQDDDEQGTVLLFIELFTRLGLAAQLKNDIVHFALFHRIQVSELHCLVTSKNVEVDPWVSGRSNSQTGGSFLPGQSGRLLLLLVWLVRRALDCDDPEIRKNEISNFETMVGIEILK